MARGRAHSDPPSPSSSHYLPSSPANGGPQRDQAGPDVRLRSSPAPSREESYDVQAEQQHRRQSQVAESSRWTHSTRRSFEIENERRLSLTQASLAQLSLNQRPVRYLSSMPTYASRPPSNTPSITSVSDDEGDDTEVMEDSLNDETMISWIRKGKGKSTLQSEGADLFSDPGTGDGMAGTLPPEILVNVFRMLDDSRDLQAALQVSRTWCLCAYSQFWYRPVISNSRQLALMTRVLRSDDPSLPYASSLRRLGLSAIASDLTDELIDGLELCRRIEKLTLTGATNLTTQGIKKLVSGLPELTTADLAAVSGVEDTVVTTIAETTPRLQGLNMTKCISVGDEGLKSIAKHSNLFRRFKISQCHRVTDISVMAIARACPLLLEVEVVGVPQLTDASLHTILINSKFLRELRFSGNTNLTDDGFPDLPGLVSGDFDDYHVPDIEDLPAHMRELSGGVWQRIIPSHTTLEFLRTVELTGCDGIGDLAVRNLVRNAPRLRHINLAKCINLTDQAAFSIAELGKHLHHLHLGHISALTDEGVTEIVRSCTRIRYLDLACCPLLTDQAVSEIAGNLTKLRRISLVKMPLLTSDGVKVLAERHSSLERLHLSHCTNLSVEAITALLTQLPRLNHMSLTGVTAFRTAELKQFCRLPPVGYNDHQRQSFCVYSNSGINNLRTYLQNQMLEALAENGADSRRTSTSSQSSGGADHSPPPHLPPFIPQSYMPLSGPRAGRVIVVDEAIADRTRSGMPIYRYATAAESERYAPSYRSTIIGDNLATFHPAERLGAMFSSTDPNYLSPTPARPSAPNDRRHRNASGEATGGTSLASAPGSSRNLRWRIVDNDEPQGDTNEEGSFRGNPFDRTVLRTIPDTYTPIPPSEPLNEEPGPSASTSSSTSTGRVTRGERRGLTESGSGAFKWMTNTLGWTDPSGRRR